MDSLSSGKSNSGYVARECVVWVCAGTRRGVVCALKFLIVRMEKEAAPLEQDEMHLRVELFNGEGSLSHRASVCIRCNSPEASV